MSDKSDPLSFTVMSLNLRFGLAEDGPNNWVCRRHAFLPLMESYPSDFLAFQEANDFQVAFLSALLPDHDHIGQRDPAPERWQSNVLFYHRRWRCLHHEHFYLSTTPHKPSRFHGSRWPRQCTMGVFQRGCFCLVVVNTHFDFSEEVQIRSARLIRKRLRRHAGKGPTVLMGDFNNTPESACYKEFTTETDRTQKFRNAFPPPYTGTHHGFNGGHDGGPIDWILFRGALKVHQASVITERFGGIYPSDHYPLVAEFSPSTCGPATAGFD